MWRTYFHTALLLGLSKEQRERKNAKEQQQEQHERKNAKNFSSIDTLLMTFLT